MTQTTAQKGLLDRTDAAAYLSISLTTLRSLVNAKELPVVRVLSATRYSIKDLDAYIERLRRTA